MEKRNNPVLRALRAGTSSQALRWPAVLITAEISLIVHIFGSVDLDFEFLGIRIVLALVSLVPMFFLIWAAHQIRLTEAAKTYLILGSYLVGGMVRGLVLYLLLNLLGVLDSWYDWSRVVASAVSMSTTIFITTYTLSYFKNHSDAVAELVQENESLFEAVEKLKTRIDKDSSGQAKRVTLEIFEELKRIKLRPGKDQAEQIQKIIEKQVKPLSKKFASNIGEWIPSGTTPKRVSFLSSWKKLNPSMSLPSPWYALTLLSLAPMPTAYARFGAKNAIEVGFYIFLVMAPSIYFGFRFARKYLPRFRRPWSDILFTVMMELIALPGVLATHVALLDTHEPDVYVLGGLLIFPIFAWLLAIGGALDLDLKNQQKQLSDVGEKLRWATARLNLLAWFNQGLISRLLHGPIQNSMHATLIRSGDYESSQVVENLIRDLKKRISATLFENDSDAKAGSRYLHALKDSVKLWDGIATITILTSKDAETVMKKDPPLAAILKDLCNEICSNAIRHGKATELTIHLTQERTLIRVEATDNASKPKLERPSGLGSRFLDNCSTRWTMSRHGKVNKLIAYLPGPD